jgi:hypothetical protein
VPGGWERFTGGITEILAPGIRAIRRASAESPLQSRRERVAVKSHRNPLAEPHVR